MLAGRKIVLGITGSIAAYKAPLMVRQLIKAGAEVKVIMTPSSSDFVSKLTLSTLSKKPVLTDLFSETEWANHVELGRWADLMIIAPLSCNTLAKMATAQCDNLLLAVYLSAVCPVMVAPAMDEDMWHHPATKKNIQILEKNGCNVLKVGYGELASGLIGDGRMAEPEQILESISDFFKNANQLKGKKALVTAGPTYEAIDPVRFVSNHSSGKMGFALAEELARRGADVLLISGPVSIMPVQKTIKLIKVTTAKEMHDSCIANSKNYDIAIMAAAVADYTPEVVSKEKIKKKDAQFTITLKKTDDILGTLGKLKTTGQLLVGFALETNNEEENARKKLNEKNADAIILNSMNDEGATFGSDSNKVTIFYKNGTSKKMELKSKSAVAKDIIDSLNELI